MKLRYAGVCRLCGAQLPAKETAIYEKASKTVRCIECPDEAPTPASHTPFAASGSPPAPSADADSNLPAPHDTAPTSSTPEDHGATEDEAVDSGVAGASARREYERRMTKRDARVRAEFPVMGGALLKVFGPGQSTKAWDQGAIGEEMLGRRLDGLAERGIGVLHDRRIPKSRANIDHLAVTPAGVWVIDAKRYKGRPDLQIEGGLFRPRTEKLVVGGRDRTNLVDGVLKQMDLVKAVVGDVPVFGALCFIEADWPLIAGTFTTRGIHVLMPRKLAKILAEQSGPVDVPAVHRALAAHFTAA